MIEKSVEVTLSLEARPAALLVQIANKFSASTKIQLDNKYANAKSIMGIISLGILDNSTVTLLIDGDDEEQAMKELVDFLIRPQK